MGRSLPTRKEDRWKIKVWIYLWFYLSRGTTKLYVAKANQQTIYQSRGQGAFTLNEWIEQWLVIVKKEVKLSTFASYSYKLSNYVLKQWETLH